MPLIGASGAVAGVIAAYIMLHPRVRVWVLAFRFIPLRISAALALGAWILTQLVMVALPQIGPVAWWAHIGASSLEPRSSWSCAGREFRCSINDLPQSEAAAPARLSASRHAAPGCDN